MRDDAALQKRVELPELPKAPATSLQLETGQAHARTALLATALARLEKNLGLLANEDGFQYIREVIENRLSDWWGGRTLHIQNTTGKRKGIFRGLDEYGQLRLEESDGTIILLADAEVLGFD